MGRIRMLHQHQKEKHGFNHTIVSQKVLPTTVSHGKQISQFNNE